MIRPYEFMKPVAKPAPEAASIFGSSEIIRVDYDLSELRITILFKGSTKEINVVFSTPVGFRVLDEGDLVEFWEKYHMRNGWLYEVKSGGWHDLELKRDGYLSQLTNEIKEYLVVGENYCVSVMVHESERPKVTSGSAT